MLTLLEYSVEAVAQQMTMLADVRLTSRGGFRITAGVAEVAMTAAVLRLHHEAILAHSDKTGYQRAAYVQRASQHKVKLIAYETTHVTS